MALADPLPAGAPDVPVEEGPPPTELVVKDLKEGTGAAVLSTDKVTANYIGVSCSTGKIFDSTYDGVSQIVFGLDRVVAGWTQGIPGMKVGGSRRPASRRTSPTAPKRPTGHRPRRSAVVRHRRHRRSAPVVREDPRRQRAALLTRRHTQYTYEVSRSIERSCGERPSRVLALLSDGPKYGLQLRHEFEARTGEVWPLNVGQVYTTLQRFERDGLVASDGRRRVRRRATPSRPTGPASCRVADHAARGRPAAARRAAHQGAGGDRGAGRRRARGRAGPSPSPHRADAASTRRSRPTPPRTTWRWRWSSTPNCSASRPRSAGSTPPTSDCGNSKARRSARARPSTVRVRTEDQRPVDWR